MKIKLPFTIKIPERVKNITAIVVLVAFLLIGVFAYLGRYAYAEDGHNWYLFIYVLACGGLFFGIRKLNLIIIAVSVLVAFGVQGFANSKFNWRQAYISEAMAGKQLVVVEMMDTYPTYEQHIFSFLGKPDWVRLEQECIEPALEDLPTGPNCGSAEVIFNHYNVDIIGQMSGYAVRMRNTARLLNEGQLTRRIDYQNCIQAKSCATIPLLPRGVDAEQVDPSSQDYLDIRQAFWSLINEDRLSPEACALTPVCRAMVKLGLLDQNALPF